MPHSKKHPQVLGCFTTVLLMLVLSVGSFAAAWAWMDYTSSPERISSYSSGIPDTEEAYTPKNIPVQQQKSSYPISPLDIAGRIENAAPPAKNAGYTILMVLNGSDLETQNGFATDDVMEILGSRLDTGKINFLILAGGTLEWKNSLMPNGEYAVYRVLDGKLETLCTLGRQDLSNPALLAGFLDLGYRVYPAERYGLIFWDHGGGAVIGCGYDEITEKSLLLPQFELALASSRAAEEPLEFIGFDACIMANLETACICSRYANCLIASEELEPGNGWDYSFLTTLSQNPSMTGEEIGREVGKRYISYYNTLIGRMFSVRATISVTDLEQMPSLVQAVEQLAEAANQKLMSGGYSLLAKARGRTMDFAGTGGEDDYDLVDLADLCRQLSPDFPAESQEVLTALEKAVVFCGCTENVENANGLTVYFPFYAKLSSYEYLPIYERLDILPHYTEFIVNFARILNGESIAVSSGFNPSAVTPSKGSDGVYSFQLSPEELEDIYAVRFALWKVVEKPEAGLVWCIELEEGGNAALSEDGSILTRFDGYCTALNGNPCCLLEVSRTSRETRCYIPAVLNGQDVRLMVQFSEKSPDGTILGAAPETGCSSFPLPQRGLIAVRPGDKLQLRYPAALFSTGGESSPSSAPPERYEGEEWTVKGALKLEKLPADAGEYLYGFILVDTQLNEYPTDFIWTRLSHADPGLGAA